MRLSPALLLVALAPLSASAHEPAAAQQPAVKSVMYDSPSVGRKLKYNVVLPSNYESSDQRYPVLYLLHGLTGNYTNWARMNVPKFAKEYNLIVVMPDGGNAWYVNWSESAEGQKNNWEDAIIKDLIPHVDSTYRTIATREGRAINGLSMGGYGALMLGLKHPELFCTIGSHSGAVGFAKMVGERLKTGNGPATPKRQASDTPNPAIGLEDFDSPVERTPKGKMFVKPEDAEAYDPFKLVLTVPKDKLPHIYIDCGTEDGLIKGNQDLVKILMENKIPFTYAESPGAHNGAYWSREVGHSMAVQYHILQRSLSTKPQEPKVSQ